MTRMLLLILFFFNDTATTEIYTLSLHDALPICLGRVADVGDEGGFSGNHSLGFRMLGLAECGVCNSAGGLGQGLGAQRSEEHTSELQSLTNLVCRLLLAKKKLQART